MECDTLSLALCGFAVVAACFFGVQYHVKRKQTRAVEQELSDFKAVGALGAADVKQLNAERDTAASTLRTEHKRADSAEAANRAGLFLGIGEGDVKPTATPDAASLSPTSLLKLKTQTPAPAPAAANVSAVEHALRERLKGDRWLFAIYRLQCQKLRSRLRSKIELELSYMTEAQGGAPIVAQTMPPSHRMRLRAHSDAQPQSQAQSQRTELSHAVPARPQTGMGVIIEPAEATDTAAPTPVSTLPLAMSAPAPVHTLLPLSPRQKDAERITSAAGPANGSLGAPTRLRAVSDPMTQPGGEPSPVLVPGAPAMPHPTGMVSLFPVAETEAHTSPSVSSLSPATSGVLPYSPLTVPARPAYAVPTKAGASDTTVAAAATSPPSGAVAAQPAGQPLAKPVVMVTPLPAMGIVVCDERKAAAAMTARVMATTPSGERAAFAATAIGSAQNGTGKQAAPRLLSLEKLSETHAGPSAIAGAGANQAPVVKPDSKRDPLETVALVAEALHNQQNTTNALNCIGRALAMERDGYRRQILAGTEALEELKRDQLQKEQRMSSELEKAQQHTAEVSQTQAHERAEAVAELNSTIQKLQSELKLHLAEEDEQHALILRLQTQLSFSQNQVQELDAEVKRLSPKVEECETRFKAQLEQAAVLADECTAVLRDISRSESDVMSQREKTAKDNGDALDRLLKLADTWQGKVNAVRESAHRHRARSETRLNNRIVCLRTALGNANTQLRAHTQQWRGMLSALRVKYNEFAAEAQAATAAALRAAVEHACRQGSERHAVVMQHLQSALQSTAAELATFRVLYDTAKVKHDIERVQLQTRAERFEKANADGFRALQRLGTELAGSFEPQRDGLTLALVVDKSLRAMKGRVDKLDKRVRAAIKAHTDRTERAREESKCCGEREKHLKTELSRERLRADALQRNQNLLRAQMEEMVGANPICERLNELTKRVEAANHRVGRLGSTLGRVRGLVRDRRTTTEAVRKAILQTVSNLRSQLLHSQNAAIKEASDNSRDFAFAAHMAKELDTYISDNAGRHVIARVNQCVEHLNRLEQRIGAAKLRLAAMPSFRDRTRAGLLGSVHAKGKAAAARERATVCARPHGSTALSIGAVKVERSLLRTKHLHSQPHSLAAPATPIPTPMAAAPKPTHAAQSHPLPIAGGDAAATEMMAPGTGLLTQNFRKSACDKVQSPPLTATTPGTSVSPGLLRPLRPVCGADAINI